MQMYRLRNGLNFNFTSAIPIATRKAISTPTCTRAARGVNIVKAPLVPTLNPRIVAPPNFRAKTPPGSWVTM